MTKNRKKVDRLIKEAIQNELENSPSPLTADIAWEQLETKLNHQQPRYNHSPFYKNKIFYSVAIILVSLIVFLSPQTSGAYSKVVEVFQKVQENVTQLFIKVSDHDPVTDNLSPLDGMYEIEESEMLALEMSIEDAQSETAFFIKQPEFVPKEYALENVMVIKGEFEQSNEVILNYKGQGKNFDINQKLLEESFSGGVTINNDDAQIDSINLHGQPASLLHYNNGFLELIWVTESHYYSIEGMLSEDEIVKIANSL